MAFSSQFDALEFDQLFLSYNKIESDLSPEPRLVAGTNMMTTLGGKLAKRLGTLLLADCNHTLRCDRLWPYETQEASPKLFFLGSFYNASTTKWVMYYNRPASATGWVTMGSTRDLDASTRPHEAVSSRGLMFIKGFPAAASSEKLGTAIFDGSGASPVVRFWGLAGPTQPAKVKGAVTKLTATVTSSGVTFDVASGTGFPATPFTLQCEYEQVTVTSKGTGLNWTVTRAVNGTTAAAHDANTVVMWRNWSASDHRVDVNVGWTYTYAWKSVTNHISCRAPLQTNMDLAPSVTGPFTDLKPVMTVRGHADTTNVPSIVIYRSVDGGGTYYALETITNTGDVDIDYTDDSLGTGSAGTTYNDPLPDSSLDKNNIAPSLTSNSPPPTVLAPLVTGTDTVAASSNLMEYAGRIWYAVGNTLFYSGDEEISEGVPEEAFPSGLLGNFFRLRAPVVDMVATTEAAYIRTLQDTYILTGSNRETFSVDPLFSEIGAPISQLRAVTRFKDAVAGMTQDYRVVLFQGKNLKTISDPLKSDLTAVSTTDFDLKYWPDEEKEYLIVSAHNKTTPTSSRQWVYDLKLAEKTGKPFWFPPWTIRSVASMSSRVSETALRRRMIFGIWDGTYFKLVYLDPTGATGSDIIPDGTTAGIAEDFTTHLMTVPAGNHVNALRKPNLLPNVHSVNLERTAFSGDSDPTFVYYKDDLWTTTNSITAFELPPRRAQSIGYTSLTAPINEVATRFAFKLSHTANTYPFELQNFAVVWTPESGT